MQCASVVLSSAAGQRNAHARARPRVIDRALSTRSSACDHRSSEQRRRNSVSGGSRARGRATAATAPRPARAGTTHAAATTAAPSKDSAGVTSPVRPAGAAPVICVTVQQHAARSDACGAGRFAFAPCARPAQQQAERTTPSYAQRYHDAVALAGASARASRTRTTRRTRLHHTHARAIACTGICQAREWSESLPPASFPA